MMNRPTLLLIAVMAIMAGGILRTSAQDTHIEMGTNEFCPVTPEEAVDPEIFVEYEGKKIFFCCMNCRRKFLADPESYTASAPQSPGPHDAIGNDGHVDSHGEASHHQEANGNPGEGSDVHDHALDHGASEGLSRGVIFLGKFHPLVVHFPIALITVALLSEGMFIWRRRPFFGDAARFTVVLGAAGAVAAVLLGWIAAAGSSYPSNQVWVLGVHRWLGVGVAIAAVAAAGLSFVQSRSRRLLIAYRASLVIATVLVGLAGHFGASLIYGTDYFSW